MNTAIDRVNNRTNVPNLLDISVESSGRHQRVLALMYGIICSVCFVHFDIDLRYIINQFHCAVREVNYHFVSFHHFVICRPIFLTVKIIRIGLYWEKQTYLVSALFLGWGVSRPELAVLWLNSFLLVLICFLPRILLNSLLLMSRTSSNVFCSEMLAKIITIFLKTKNWWERQRNKHYSMLLREVLMNRFPRKERKIIK